MAFGKSKSMTDAAPENGGQQKVKKSKGFKRIRGFLTGESRKERKARKAAAKAAAADTRSVESNQNDEADTIFGVDVDDRSTLTGALNSTTATEASFLDGKSKEDPKRTYILKVVLLLMDPETRRFELLQLEFDSLKALVSDVLAQIPISVTEEALRVQTYTGIAGKDGVEMVPNKLLASFCKGNEVLVAVPEGVSPKECARLARPILNDDKVVNMLSASGIDASGWKEDPKKKKKKSALKNTSTTNTTTRSLPEPKAEPLDASSGSATLAKLIFVVLLSVGLKYFHTYISAPILPGKTMSPGVWLSKCGLLTVLPSCENSYLHLNREGLLTHYNAAKQVTWQMEGTVCEDDDQECFPGLVYHDDGRIVIGGKTVTYVTSFVKEIKMSPWPFEEVPKLKVWKK